MTYLSDDNQADIIEAFNSPSRYLDDLLNINNNYFEGMVNHFKPPFWIYISLFLSLSFCILTYCNFSYFPLVLRARFLF